jgi:hypothetical protein
MISVPLRDLTRRLAMDFGLNITDNLHRTTARPAPS